MSLMPLDMRYQNRHVDTQVLSGLNVMLDMWLWGYSLIVNNHYLDHNGIVLWPETSRSSTFKWLEFITAYIPVLAMYGYMACGGSSLLYVGLSDRPRWNLLPGVNRDKILCYLSYSWWISTWPGQTRLTRKEFWH